MAIKSAKSFHPTLLLLAVQLAASIHGATLMPRAPNDAPVYVMNPEAVEFHDSCLAKNPKNDAETKQDFIQRAWASALEMAAAAQTRFTDTRSKVGDHGDAPMSLLLMRMILDASDPGYVQFFKLDYTASTVLYGRQIWSGITGSINKKPGDGPRPANNQINIICGPVEKLEPSWEDSCKYNPQGKVIAGTRSSKDQNSNTLYICDTFFERDRFDLLKAATEPGAAPDQNGVTAVVFNKVRQLEGQQGTDGKSRSLPSLPFPLPLSSPLSFPSISTTLTPSPAQTLLHEWTHLWWIGPTNSIVNANVAQPVQNPPEVYGWYECASLAARSDYADKGFVENADSYAWYAEYGYLKDRLGADHWPSQGPHEKPTQPM